MNEDIRWKQRFSNYRKALSQLTKFIDKGDLNMFVWKFVSSYRCCAILSSDHVYTLLTLTVSNTPPIFEFVASRLSKL